MRVFKTRWFAKFASKKNMPDSKLAEAIREIENGLIDADYGGGLIKKRISRTGGGKSGGYRSVIAYRSGVMSVFMYCFAKNEKDNLDKHEVNEFKYAASLYLNLSETEIETATEKNELEEVQPL